jgi:hypothetical protein
MKEYKTRVHELEWLASLEFDLKIGRKKFPRFLGAFQLPQMLESLHLCGDVLGEMMVNYGDIRQVFGFLSG